MRHLANSEPDNELIRFLYLMNKLQEILVLAPSQLEFKLNENVKVVSLHQQPAEQKFFN